uniref:Gag-pol polyprotein n=1 Tax=Solanum tuberosum TaxID=4113 RepID=M1DMI3_SOLTU
MSAILTETVVGTPTLTGGSVKFGEENEDSVNRREDRLARLMLPNGRKLDGFAGQRDDMSRFVMGVSNLVEEECRTEMLHDDMNIFRLMVYAQSIEESKIKRKNRQLKRVTSDEKGQPRFKNRAPNQDCSRTPRVNQEKGGGSSFSKPTCTTCRKRHYGKCLAGTNGCYGCRKNDHQVRDFPTLATKGRGAKQASLCGPYLEAPKKNCFYVLQAKEGK